MTSLPLDRLFLLGEETDSLLSPWTPLEKSYYWASSRLSLPWEPLSP